MIADVRTKDAGYVESVSVDVVLANAVVTTGGRFVKGLTRNDRDHEIRVQVPGRGVRVRARRVYTAPPESPSAK